ncbi:J domain-containing protein [Vulcanococcus limneticus]|uniref:J domain-containing protein n=1 Tax=Vulcanococcus limneticus TaxID=2170428 RepID=UPI00398BC1D1
MVAGDSLGEARHRGHANHYELLQLEPSASAQELRQAFRRLSKLYHPDTTTLPEVEAQEAFGRLQQAYHALSDPERRRAYDASLVATLAATPPAPPPNLRRVVTRPPASVRRDLSGGEWFALVLLALAVVFSLVLGVGLAWARGAELVRPPSWWPAPVDSAGQTADFPASARSDVAPAVAADPPVSPPPAGPGAVAAGAGGGAAAG